MEPRRDPLSPDSIPAQLPDGRPRTVDDRWQQIFELLRLSWTPHPEDFYSRSDLLVMAAEHAHALDAQVLAERLLTDACRLREDKVVSARGSMLTWMLERDEWEGMELSESWRRDRSCNVADHEEVAEIWLEHGEYTCAWGWAERGLMLAEELELPPTATRWLVQLRDEILVYLGREPAPRPYPDHRHVVTDEPWRTAA